MNTPSESTLTPQPILPGAKVPFPCWLWSSRMNDYGFPQWICHRSDGLASYDDPCHFYTHYLVAPIDADPATFPRPGERMPIQIANDGLRASYGISEELAHKLIMVGINSEDAMEGVLWRDLIDIGLNEADADTVMNAVAKLEASRPQPATPPKMNAGETPSAGTEQKERGEGLWAKGFKVEHSVPAAPTDGTTTPRTDAVWSRWNDEGFRVIGPLADCSRQIERELFVASALALDINDELTATKDAYKRMCELMEQAKQCATDLTKRENELEERIATLEAEKSAQSMMVLVPVDEHDKQEAELADLTCRLALTEKRLGEAQEARADSEHRGLMLAKATDNATAHMKNVEAQLATSQARLVEVEAEVERLTPDHNVSAKIQDDNIVLRSSLAAAEAALNEAKERAQDWQLAHKNQAEEFVGREKVLHEKNTELRAALVQAKQESQANLMQMNLVVATRDQARAANTALQEQVAQLQGAMGKYESPALEVMARDNQITALSAQVEELKRDGERLDFIERTREVIFGYSGNDAEGRHQWWVEGVGDLPALRLAIDAARAQEEGA